MVNAALLWTHVDITTCEWGPREKLLDNLLLTVFCKEASVFYFNFSFGGFPVTLKNFPYSSELLSTSQELQNVCSSLVVCLHACSVQFSCSAVSNSLPPHRLEHARLLQPSLTPGACPKPCPSSQWCHPTISSSVVPFSSCPPSCPASGSFPVSQFFASGGWSTEQVACLVLSHCFVTPCTIAGQVLLSMELFRGGWGSG